MRALFFTFIITLCFVYPTFGQDSNSVNYSISTNISQYLFLDFPVTFEKYYNRHTIGLTLSYRPSTINSAVISGGYGAVLGTGYTNQNYHNYLYNAMTIGLNSKYYLTTHTNKFYIDVNVFYRYWWFDNKHATYEKNVENFSEYHFDGIRSEKQNILGLKLLMGQTRVFREGHKIRPIINLYAGLGLRYKMYSFETFNGYVNDDYYAYKKDAWSEWTPTIEFGLNVGLAVCEKK